MKRPRLLDLFCCQGGAGMGYHRAGFDVTGVDVNPQPRYPFRFIQGDALTFLAEHGAEFDAVHASPPCQAYSALKSMASPDHPELVEPTRAALVELGRPWVMENVVGAPMPSAVVLCGTMFGLGATGPDGIRRQLLRHRLFEHHPDVELWPPFTCQHRPPFIGVYGGGTTRGPGTAYTGGKPESAEAIGADWMNRYGLAQAIPPAYTEHIGRQLLEAIR